MAQTNPYERYIEHSKERLSNNSAIQASNRLARSLNPEFKKQQRRLDIMGAKGQLTAGAEAQASLDIATKKAEVIGTFQQKASDADLLRRESIQEKIDLLEIKSEEWEEAEADRLEAEKQQGLAGAIKTIGTVAGGIAGSLIPGVGTAVGASLGSGLGSLIGAGVTDDEYVNDLQAVSSGIGEIGMGIASGLSIRSENIEMKKNTDLVRNIVQLTDADFVNTGMDKTSFLSLLMSQMNMDNFDAETFATQYGFNFGGE